MEMVGFFIILGALVVVVLRHQIWPNAEGSKGKAEAVEEAAQRMKREMERSADEIIKRMSDHIERLEHLVEEADQRVKLLEAQLETLCRPILPQPGVAPKNEFDDLLAASLAVDNAIGQGAPNLRPPSKPSPAASAHALQGAPVAYDDSAFMDATEPGDFAEEPSVEETFAEETFVEEPYGDSGLLTVAAWEDGEGEIEETEVVVSASVADVADLPLTPEEAAWAAAEEGLPEIPREDYLLPADAHEAFMEESAAPPTSFPAPEELDLGAVGLVGQAASEPVLLTADGTREEQALSSAEVVPESGIESNRLDSTASLSPRSASEAAVLEEDVDGDAVRMTVVEGEEEEESESASLEVSPAALPEGDLPAQKIRERLSEGKSTTEIAKEFHIGRGAVELISQMVKNKTAS